jgi:integrase
MADKSRRDRGTGCYYEANNGTYRIKFYADGKAHYESTGLRGKEGAKAARDLLKNRLREVDAGTFVHGSDKLRIKDLVDLLLQDYARRERKSADRAKIACAHLLEYFEFISARKIATKVPGYIEARRAEVPKPANATIAYEIAMLRRSFSLAARAGLIPFRPTIEGVTVNNARSGFVDEKTFAKILTALPDHLKNPVRFMFATAWRRREVTGLRWDCVDFEAGEIRLHGKDTKSGHARVFPLHGEVKVIIEAQRDLARQHSVFSQFVFWRLSGGVAKPIMDFRGSWENATKAAAVPGILVHDLRRSRARLWSNAGVPDRVGMALGGWKTRAMYDRYGVVAKEDMTDAIDRSGSPKTKEA